MKTRWKKVRENLWHLQTLTGRRPVVVVGIVKWRGGKWSWEARIMEAMRQGDRKAIDGEAWAVQFIAERVEGKITQPMDLDVNLTYQISDKFMPKTSNEKK